MKERWKGFVSGILVTAILSGTIGTAAATIGSKMVQANYSDIKISLNGEQVTPKDANGAVVEPFAIDGTTYLPVRAVANALDLSVDWDGSTSTVLLSDHDTQRNNTLNILKLLDLCVTMKGCIDNQNILNQSVSNYVSLSFSATSSSQLQDLSTSIQALNKQLSGYLATIFLVQNEVESLKSEFDGTPFYSYCNELKTASEGMMKAYECQTNAFISAQNYCQYKTQSDFDNYITNINSSTENLISAESTYQNTYNDIYSEAVKELG